MHLHVLVNVVRQEQIYSQLLLTRSIQRYFFFARPIVPVIETKTLDRKIAVRYLKGALS
jgi:hypothetical protein